MNRTRVSIEHRTKQNVKHRPTNKFNLFSALALTRQAHSDCHFAVIDKQNFNKILKDKEREKMIQDLRQLSSLSYFNDLSYEQVQWLFLNCQRISYSKGDRVFKEGDPVQNMYIVDQGTFTVRCFLQFKASPFGLRLLKLVSPHIAGSHLALTPLLA